MADVLKISIPQGDDEADVVANAKTLAENAARQKLKDKIAADKEKLAAMQKEYAVASGAKPPTEPVFVGNKTFGRIKSLTTASPTSGVGTIATQGAGGLVGAGQSMLNTVEGLARIANNSILQIGDILTLGANHDSAVMQQVWAEQGALGAGIVRAVTEPGAVISAIGSNLSNRAAEAEVLRAAGETFQAAIIDGQLGGDVAQAVLGGASTVRGIGGKMLGTARGLRGAVAEPLPTPIEPIPEPVPTAPKPKAGPADGAYVQMAPKRPRPKPNGFDGPDGYKTHGIDANPMKSPEGRKMIDQLKAQGMTDDQALKKAREFLASGADMPKAVDIMPGDTLYKVVPEGEMPGKYSAYFGSEKDVASLKGLSYDQITDRLGIPLESQQTAQFDVVKIVAKDHTTVFESTIARTTQNGYAQPGGDIQTIIANRGAFTDPVLTGTKLP